MFNVSFSLCFWKQSPLYRRKLKVIDRHILAEWLKIFAVVLAATVGLLLVQVMFDDFPDLQERNAGWLDVVVYLLVKLPGMLAVIVPMALLVSFLYALGQLHRNNEITALRAAGLSVVRITRSLWVVALLMCGVMWALNASVVPWSVVTSRSIMERVSFKYQSKSGVSSEEVGLTRLVTFENPVDRRMWIINRYSRYLDRGFGVMVSALDAQHREQVRWQASEAKYDAKQRSWVFFDGRETHYDPLSGDILKSELFTEKAMDGFRENPALMLIFDVKPTQLSLFELETIARHLERQKNPRAREYLMRYFGLWADTAMPLIILAITVPFAVSGVRVNPAVGVSKSIGLFLLYFVMFKISAGLGTRGVMDPMLAAWLPNVGVSGVGVWLWARMR